MSQSPQLSKKRSISVQDRINVLDPELNTSLNEKSKFHREKSHQADKTFLSSSVLQSDIRSYKDILNSNLEDLDEEEGSQDSITSKPNLALLQNELEQYSIVQIDNHNDSVIKENETNQSLKKSMNYQQRNHQTIRVKDDTSSYISKQSSQFRLDRSKQTDYSRQSQTLKKDKCKKQTKDKLQKNQSNLHRSRSNSGTQFKDLKMKINDSSMLLCKDANQITKQINEDDYNLKIFDKLDSILVKQQQYINKNRQNNEKTLIRILKLDGLKSQKAQDMIQELTQTNKQTKLNHKKGERKRIVSPKNLKIYSIERNQSLPTRQAEKGLQHQRVLSKNIISGQDDLLDIPKKMSQITKKINQHQLSFEEIRYKPEFNISIFKFQNQEVDGWERLILNKEKQLIKSKISNFDHELERVNEIYYKNEQSMNRYLNVQCELISLKQKLKAQSQLGEQNDF